MLSGAEPAGLAAVVRAWDNRAHDECVQWFRTLPSMRAHCTALALAVLNGLPRADVTAAADRLIELIAPPSKDGPDPGSVVNPFAADAGVPLATLRATTTSGTLSAAEGDIPVIEMRYLDPLFPRGSCATPGTSTIRPGRTSSSGGELGGRSEPGRTGARRRRGVGVLATRAFDFVFVRNRRLGPAPRIRTCVTAPRSALGRPVQDPDLREVVARSSTSLDRRRRLPRSAGHGGAHVRRRCGLTRHGTLRQLAALAEVADNLAVAIAVARTWASW